MEMTYFLEQAAIDHRKIHCNIYAKGDWEALSHKVLISSRWNNKAKHNQEA